MYAFLDRCSKPIGIAEVTRKGWRGERNENAGGPHVRGSIENAERIKFHRGGWDGGRDICVFPFVHPLVPPRHATGKTPFLLSDAVQPTPRKINRMTMASSNIYTSNFRRD